MAEFSLRPVLPGDREWIRSRMAECWGSDFAVVHDAVFYPADLPGFIALREERRAGIISYRLAEAECEIVLLDSLVPSQGIGSALIDAVKTLAIRSGCRRLRVTTTNDNLHALRFYQLRGFALAELRPNALEKTRELKPVPLLGENGIPIRDEIELEMLLEKNAGPF
jgi:GNAT superfamily N-acetyltransferase